LFEGGFELFDDFLGEAIGIGKVVGLFAGFLAILIHLRNVGSDFTFDDIRN